MKAKIAFICVLSICSSACIETPGLSDIIDTKTQLFLQGFATGLQENATNPSACVISYSSVSASYETLLDTFSNINIDTIFYLLNNFNDLVDQFVNSYDLCGYTAIIANYFTNLETTILNLFINIFGNLDDIIIVYQELPTLMQSSDYLNIGICFGQIFRYATGIEF
jgi:hypothetical protein